MEHKKPIGRQLVVPGEKLAVVEEFSPGTGTFVKDGYVHAATYGIAHFDRNKMVISISPLKENIGRPKVGDRVEGIVSNIQAGHAIITIYRIGNSPSTHKFSALLPLRGARRGERNLSLKRGDIVEARVRSILNATVHLAINAESLGVIKTACSNCGGEVIYNRSRNTVKCIECGFREARTLTKSH